MPTANLQSRKPKAARHQDDQLPGVTMTRAQRPAGRGIGATGNQAGQGPWVTTDARTAARGRPDRLEAENTGRGGCLGCGARRAAATRCRPPAERSEAAGGGPSRQDAGEGRGGGAKSGGAGRAATL